MRPVHLQYIAYNEATLHAMPAGYELLDNVNSPRNDWYEYWPIRRFLLNETLDEEAFYGFLSPRFAEKTGLSAQQVREFIAADNASHTAYTFSPQPDMGAFFLNVFEQEDLFQPGFIDASEAFLHAAGHHVPLRTMLMDSRQVVYSNYIVARPAFWRRWLEINEQLFAVCEGPDGPLKASMTEATNYPGSAQRKIFLMERIASLVLTLEPQHTVKAYDTFRCAWSGSRLNQFKLEAVLSDALKIAMREQGFPEYSEAFAQLRDRLR